MGNNDTGVGAGAGVGIVALTSGDGVGVGTAMLTRGNGVGVDMGVSTRGNRVGVGVAVLTRGDEGVGMATSTKGDVEGGGMAMWTGGDWAGAVTPTGDGVETARPLAEGEPFQDSRCQSNCELKNYGMRRHTSFATAREIREGGPSTKSSSHSPSLSTPLSSPSGTVENAAKGCVS